MSSRWARVARGWSVGLFATLLAAVSHSVAGDPVPGPLALGAGLVFGGMLGTFALTARPSLPRLAIAVGTSQLAFHLAFSTLATAAPVQSGHLHGALSTLPAAHPHAAGPAMWLSHAAAGLLTLALLRGAERAAWHLLVELARLVVAPFRTPAPAPVGVSPPSSLLVSASARRPGERLLDRAVSRRGPPVPVAS